MSYCEEYRAHVLKVVESVDVSKVELAIGWLRQARDEGRQVFVCGNGGSASTASHFATDMVKGASYLRDRRFRIHALTDSLSTVTAYANDVSYDCVFAEQLKNHAFPGDVVLLISGSGNSPNVVEAARYAREAGCRSIALTGGDGGKLAAVADLNIGVGDPHMGRIEDLHLMLCHMICYYFIETESRPSATAA
jgi:D-sedoheptulose 7-phosphate isomerase